MKKGQIYDHASFKDKESRILFVSHFESIDPFFNWHMDNFHTQMMPAFSAFKASIDRDNNENNETVNYLKLLEIFNIIRLYVNILTKTRWISRNI